MFDETQPEPVEPVTAAEFRDELQRIPGDGHREKLGHVVDEVWPVMTDGDAVRVATAVSGSEWDPSYRQYQRETVIDMLESLYFDDNDVCLLSCPTGGGKSLLIYACVSALDYVAGGQSFVSTPLNTLIDQMQSDEYLHDVLTLKGRNNYQCVHPQDRGTAVNEAICQRDDDFECDLKEQSHTNGGCPYYGRKQQAQSTAKVVTNLSFLMANSMIPDAADAGLSSRALMAVDECHSVDSFGLMFVGFTVGEHNVPINDDVFDSMPTESDSMADTVAWIEDELVVEVTEAINDLEARRESLSFTAKDQERLEDLRRFNQKVSNFLGDVDEYEWTKTHDTVGSARKIDFQPVRVGRFLGGYLWSQANKVICSSATIPPNFTSEVGLAAKDVGRVEVPSTFPAERRPVITTEDVGKMSYYERDKTFPKLADRLTEIARLWNDHKGFVHCHSYAIAEKLYDRLPSPIQNRTTLQDGDDREGSLSRWMEQDVSKTSVYRSTGGQIFLSVGMEEGISLDDDLARWQVIAKASYPHMQDERVSFRMDDDTEDGAEWKWYNSCAVVSLIQSVGRGMRSKDDWCATYVLDTSAVNLIKRNKHLCEDWFLEAVDCDFDEAVVNPNNM